MQIFGLHKNLYKVADYASRVGLRAKADEAYDPQVRVWEMLKAHDVPEAKIAEVAGISRATYYRRKAKLKLYGAVGLLVRSRRPRKVRTSGIAQETRDLVRRLRTEHPTYGKAKITVLLLRAYGIKRSASSVGRILTTLIARGLVPRYTPYKPKRKRAFAGHAKRWNGELKPQQPGDMVQIDHMSVTQHQRSFKHFQAWDPITKTVVAELYGNAKATSAAHFLTVVQNALPFPLRSIQVDGGSEFKAAFEDACAKAAIPLYVLPPRSPKLNGGVERANRTFREEFYALPSLLADTLSDLRIALSNALYKYNHYRPHHALGFLTPAAYTHAILSPP